MSLEENLKKEIEQDDIKFKIKIKHNKIMKKRLLPAHIYCEMKAKKKCDYCHKKLTKPPEIHHKIPIRAGGSNKEENLMGLCKICHERLDLENEIKYPLDEVL